MKRFLVTLALCVCAARIGAAQNPLANAKAKAEKARDAANAHIAAEQKPEALAPQGKPAPAKPAPGKPGAKQGATGLSVAIPTDTTPLPTVIMREVYDYSRDGRRDPFLSLLTTNELRPTMNDLKLTGILYDHSGVRSIAILRDISTNAQYRVTTGAALGRMRVSAIRPKVIVFSIDEFGMNRLDSLVLGDTTKARAR